MICEYGLQDFNVNYNRVEIQTIIFASTFSRFYEKKNITN